MTTNGSMTDTELRSLEDALIASYLNGTEDELNEALKNLGLEEDFRQFIMGLEGILNTGGAVGVSSVTDTIANFRKAYEHEKSRRRSTSSVSASTAKERIAAFIGAHPRGSEVSAILQFRELDNLPDDDVLTIYMDLVSHGLIDDV